jgi:RNA 3'-terminal phosphate cyclase (ATP)
VLTIDGSFGEGGGQIVRSSLALSALTGTPITLKKIRAGRKKPGLMRQHLTAVEAAAKVCSAEVEGAALGSSRLVFCPGPVQAGEYHFSIGTAGSTSLVVETVLPALLAAEGESHLTVQGGTHNPLAPPFDFLVLTFLPLLARLGPRVSAELVRPGFFPAGRGECRFHIAPSGPLGRLDLLDRGVLKPPRVRARVARLPLHIAQRECRTIQELSGWNEDSFAVEEVHDSAGPGNVVLIELASEHLTEVFVGFGERGVPAEQVARRAWQEADAYLRSEVPVGPHLADQLMLPLALAASQGTGGGTFRTMDLTPHAVTHLDLIGRFLEIPMAVEDQGPNNRVVRIGAAKARS